MVPSRAALAVLSVARSFVQADLHHVFVPSFTSPHLYSLEFDDANNTLAQARHIVGNDGHPWISFNYDKSSLYAGETNGFASYTVSNSTSLSYKKSLPLPGPCSQKIAGFGSTYITSLQRAPFTVYGAPFGACLSAMSVGPDGTLLDIVQNITLDSSSGIHGLAMGSDEAFVFSADLSANGIWVHRVNQETGALSLVSFTPAPTANAGPRHLIVHPTGRFLYVVMEAKNEIRVYAINFGQRSSSVKITDTGLSYSLIPKDADPANYMANEVILSQDSNILFASTRYRALRAQTQADQAVTKGPLTKEDVYHQESRRSPTMETPISKTGYVTAILLVPQSEGSNPKFPQGAGFPLRQLFQSKTTTSGGMSNAVSPAPWDRNYFTISDTEIGQVEVWKIEGTTEDPSFYSGPVGQNAATREIGGWENGMWVENPQVVGQPAPAPASVPLAPVPPVVAPKPVSSPQPASPPQQVPPPQPVAPKPVSSPQPVSPTQPISPTQPKLPPTNPWAPKSGGGGPPWEQAGSGNPWGANSPPWTTSQQGEQSDRPGWAGWDGYKPSSGSSGQDEEEEKKKEKNRPAESTDASAEEEEDGEAKRRKGKGKPGVSGPLRLRRQVSVAPPAAAVPAPAPVFPVVTAKVVATWKAPKGSSLKVRSSLRDGGLLEKRQSNVTVPAEGGCCGNALWWD